MIPNFKFPPFQLFLIYLKHEYNIVSKALQIISLTAELKINIHFILNQNDHVSLELGGFFGLCFHAFFVRLFVLFCKQKLSEIFSFYFGDFIM